jgi:hypothetical protein
MQNRILAGLVACAIAGLACGTSITLPDLPTPGPEIVEQISIPVPDASPARLIVSFGAGEL